MGAENDQFDLGTPLSLTFRLDLEVVYSAVQQTVDLRKEIEAQSIKTKGEIENLEAICRAYRIMRKGNLRTLVISIFR